MNISFAELAKKSSKGKIADVADVIEQDANAKRRHKTKLGKKLPAPKPEKSNSKSDCDETKSKSNLDPKNNEVVARHLSATPKIQ